MLALNVVDLLYGFLAEIVDFFSKRSLVIIIFFLVNVLSLFSCDQLRLKLPIYKKSHSMNSILVYWVLFIFLSFKQLLQANLVDSIGTVVSALVSSTSALLLFSFLFFSFFAAFFSFFFSLLFFGGNIVLSAHLFYFIFYFYIQTMR